MKKFYIALGTTVTFLLLVITVITCLLLAKIEDQETKYVKCLYIQDNKIKSMIMEVNGSLDQRIKYNVMNIDKLLLDVGELKSDWLE